MKILITDGLSKQGLDLLTQHPNIDVDLRKKIDKKEWLPYKLPKMAKKDESKNNGSDEGLRAEIEELKGRVSKLEKIISNLTRAFD